MSTLLGKQIELPMDGAAFEALLKEKIAGSRFNKKVVTTPAPVSDLSSSFNTI